MSEAWGSGPQRLGRYIVRRRIGSGGFATVWLAYDEQLDAPVAIKVLADNWTDEHQVRTRFVEEGRYLRRVESPHVVTVYDAGELEDGRPYLVMTYADQGTLAERLEIGPGHEPLTVGQSLEIVRQVAAGLQALHDRGILHRDVKPANVLFRSSRGGTDGAAGADGPGGPGGPGEMGELRVMVGDLGLGKALDISSRLTMIAGTPAFVAPEQAQGETPDARADQYSLAVLTYVLLTGRRPWDHTSLPAAAAPAPPPPLSTLERRFPAAAEEVVVRGLSRLREDRFDTVSEYAARLSAAFEGDSGLLDTAETRLFPLHPDRTHAGAAPTPYPASDWMPEPPQPGRRWPRRLGAAAVLVAVLGGGAVAGYVAQQETETPLPTSAVAVEDETGTLGVSVPRDWTAESRSQWMPPNAADEGFPALSIGVSPTWAEDGGNGVFLGVLPGNELPNPVPQHKRCGSSTTAVTSEIEGDQAVTQFFASCPGSTVIVERVVQVSAGQLLWVQIRAADRSSATKVLDSVRVFGL